MTRLLLLNQHSLLNAGDAALLQVTLSGLRMQFPAARIQVVSNYPGESQLAGLGVEALPSPAALTAGRAGRGELTALVEGIRRADLVLSLPGNPFFSMGRLGTPLLLSALPVWMALRAGRPLVVLPQTLGPFRRRWEASLLRGLYRRARRVWLRDAPSLRTARAWGLPHAALAPDPGLLLPAASSEAARAVLAQSGYPGGRPALGVSVIPRMVLTLSEAALQSFYTALAAALDLLAAETGLVPVFFAQCTGPALREDDRIPAREVLARLSRPGAAVTIFDALPAQLLKACYGQMEAVLAARLHAGLFALGAGVPALLVGYLEKTAGALETLGLPGWGLSLESAGESALGESLRRLWSERTARRALLQERLPGWQDAARRPLAELPCEF